MHNKEPHTHTQHTHTGGTDEPCLLCRGQKNRLVDVCLAFVGMETQSVDVACCGRGVPETGPKASRCSGAGTDTAGHDGAQSWRMLRPQLAEAAINYNRVAIMRVELLRKVEPLNQEPSCRLDYVKRHQQT